VILHPGPAALRREAHLTGRQIHAVTRIEVRDAAAFVGREVAR
jgi:hypothetical protein